MRLRDLKCDVPEGQSGPWRIERFVIDPEAARLYNLGLLFEGNGRYAVEPGTYTRLAHEHTHDPIMSDTPAEVRALKPAAHAFERYGGRVLINGLGLGLVVKVALMAPAVEHVDVVEIDPDVIRLVAPHYGNGRVTVYEADAFTIQWPRGTRWSAVWHDIWPTICGDNAEGIGRLKRRYAQRCVWQAAWEEQQVRYQNHRDSRIR